MSWTCCGCEVTIRYAPGAVEVPELPSGWAEVSGGKLLCLGCRRTDAVEVALAEAERSERKVTAAAASGDALAAFELKRDPGRSNGQIASVIGTSAAKVEAVRFELLCLGEIERRPPGPPIKRKPRTGPHPSTIRSRELRERIEAELRSDPARADTLIAEAVGCCAETVRPHRHRLEKAGEIGKPTRRRKAAT